MSPTQKESVENRLKQLHEYNRHVAQLIVAWFTFFVTVNYAVMGWLLSTVYAAKPVADSVPHSIWLLRLIVFLFALQNLLGICACRVIRSHLLASASLVHQLEASLAEPELPSFLTVPVDVYGRSLGLMLIALVVLMSAWFSLLFVCR
jgi:hypothetical protein